MKLSAILVLLALALLPQQPAVREPLFRFGLLADVHDLVACHEVVEK